MMPEAVSGLRAAPCPTPIWTMGSAIPIRYEVSAERRLSQAIPIRVTVRPHANSRPLPRRWVSRGTPTATAKLTTVIGRKARPAWKAL